MALISYKDWQMKESSPSTRRRDGWARYGNYPMPADVMSHSTPAPFVIKKAEEELGKKKRKKKKK